MSMKQLADHIMSVAQRDHIPVSNLKLQKIMYFVLKEAKREKLLSEEQLIDIYNEPFLVWRFGPVVLEQYDRFKGFTSEPILGTFEEYQEFKCLDNLIMKYLKKDVFELVEESYNVVFWKENEQYIKGFRSDIEYPLEVI